ncbi:MAG: hypothetical protein ABS60_10535 [Microbacterium sp. SCN 71-17]|nr:MAG: hypothetical protein ABS60_10535 [Microbacterium sp. SCN 71-17]
MASTSRTADRVLIQARASLAAVHAQGVQDRAGVLRTPVEHVGAGEPTELAARGFVVGIRIGEQPQHRRVVLASGVDDEVAELADDPRQVERLEAADLEDDDAVVHRGSSLTVAHRP